MFATLAITTETCLRFATAWTDYGKDTLFRIKKRDSIEEIAHKASAQVFREKVILLTSRYTSEGGKLIRTSN